MMSPNECGLLLIALIGIGFILEWVTDKIESAYAKRNNKGEM